MHTRRAFWRLLLAFAALAVGAAPVALGSNDPAAHAGAARFLSDGRAPDSASDARDAGAGDAAAACIRWRTEVRYRPYGYDHLVHIDNGCNAGAMCRVSTDVNPNVITVRVPRGESVTVVTFQGSPSRVFSAKVVCTLERR